MAEILAIIRDGFALVVGVAIPLVVAGVIATLLAGWVGRWTGIQDGVIGIVLRTAAVVMVVVVMAPRWRRAFESLARDALIQVGDLGRETPRPSRP